MGKRDDARSSSNSLLRTRLSQCDFRSCTCLLRRFSVRPSQQGSMTIRLCILLRSAHLGDNRTLRGIVRTMLHLQRMSLYRKESSRPCLHLGLHVQANIGSTPFACEAFPIPASKTCTNIHRRQIQSRACTSSTDLILRRRLVRFARCACILCSC